MHDSKQIIAFIIITTCIIFLLALLTMTLLFFYNLKRLAYQKNLEAMKINFERDILKTQVEIQEQTFQHISREIHDNINLSLTLAKLNLNTVDWQDSGNAREGVNSSIKILGSVIADLSHLSKSMNTDMIQELGLMKVIKNEVEKVENMAHLEVVYQIKGEPVFINCEKELVVFRIVQEAFNNIIKHSKASKVWLVLKYDKDFLDISIEDDGIGFDQTHVTEYKNSNAGLQNMQTRTKTFGGQFFLNSTPQKGTQIFVSVPYN